MGPKYNVCNLNFEKRGSCVILNFRWTADLDNLSYGQFLCFVSSYNTLSFVSNVATNATSPPTIRRLWRRLNFSTFVTESLHGKMSTLLAWGACKVNGDKTYILWCLCELHWIRYRLHFPFSVLRFDIFYEVTHQNWH